jgi:hypothetical protein
MYRNGEPMSRGQHKPASAMARVDDTTRADLRRPFRSVMTSQALHRGDRAVLQLAATDSGLNLWASLASGPLARRQPRVQIEPQSWRQIVDMNIGLSRPASVDGHCGWNHLVDGTKALSQPPNSRRMDSLSVRINRRPRSNCHPSVSRKYLFPDRCNR